MKIICFTVVWNEEFLLPYFLKHYSFCDQIVVFDNGSDDGTKTILNSSPRTRVIPFDTNNQLHSFHIIDIKNTCWKGADADYVIICDVDEFIIPDWQLLEQHHSEQVAFKLAGVEMFGPRAGGIDIEDISAGKDCGGMSKVAMFNPKIDEINYLAGAHVARPSCPVIDGMVLRHYCFLSLEYVTNRWHRYNLRRSTSDKRHGLCTHYNVSDAALGKTFHHRQRKINRKEIPLRIIYDSDSWKAKIKNTPPKTTPPTMLCPL